MADTKLSQLTLKTGNMVASDLVEITEGGNTTKSVTGTKILGLVSASGNAATVTNGVYTVGTQNIGGDKTFGDDVTITGDLTVNGTTTTIDTTNLTVTDPLVKFGQGYTGTAYDQGFVVTRGNGSATNTANRGFIWDETADEFVAIACNTENGTTAGNVTINSYVDMQVAKLTGSSLDISGDIDVDGTTNLDIVDIDGAVDMATTLQVDGVATFSTRLDVSTKGRIEPTGDNLDIRSLPMSGNINLYTSGGTKLVVSIGGALTTFNGNVNPSADSSHNLGSTSVRWLKGWFDTITAGTMTIGSGSITDSSGAITFGNENLVTTGTLGSGALTAGTIAGTTGTFSGDVETTNGKLTVERTGNAGTDPQAAAPEFINIRNTAIDTANEVFGINFNVDISGTDKQLAYVMGKCYASSNYNSGLIFGTRPASSGEPIQALEIDSSQNATFAGDVVTVGELQGTTNQSWGGTLSANANYRMYASTSGGLVIAGKGSSTDIAIVNNAGQDVMSVPTGTTAATFAGTVTANNTITTIAPDADHTSLEQVASSTTGAVRQLFKNSNNSKNFELSGFFSSGTEQLAIQSKTNTITRFFHDGSVLFEGNINAVAGGINLGATGSANLLDDYEEGTWTPAVGYASGSNSTGYAARLGNYVKVGNMVSANLYIVTNSHSAGSGQLSISGFPFTAKPDNTYHAGTIGYMQGIAGGATTNTITSFLPGNSTAMSIKSTNNSAVGDIAFTDATHIIINITYQTA